MKFQRFRVIKFALIIGLLVSIACADFFSYELYSVFYPETSVRPKDHDKYFFTYYYPYGEESYSYEATSDDTLLNTNAWYEYFGKKIGNDQIKVELHKNENLSEDFIKKVKSLGNQNALNYLLSLKEIDNLIADKRESYWDERKPIDTLRIKNFIIEIESSFLNEKDDFLKERYLYLLIKYSSAIKDFKNVIYFFEKYNTKIKVKSYVSEWSQSYFAGAFYHIGNHPRSYYEFSKVFAHCPSRKAVANLSVKTYSIPFTDDVLKLCKSDEEIANVYAIYGLQSFSDIVLAIEKIMGINPNHELLQLLISRAINQQEHYFYNAKNHYYSYYFYDDQEKERDEQKIIADSKIQLKRLENLITKNIENASTQNVDFYHLSDAYLKLLDLNFQEAQLSLAKVKNLENNIYITKQQKTLQIIQKLQSGVTYDEISFGPVLDDLSFLAKSLNTARDVSVMKYLSQMLVQYYEANEIPVIETKKSFWQGCSKKKEIKPSALLLARTFYSRSLSNVEHVWYENRKIDDPTLKIDGFDLDTISLVVLESAVSLVEDKYINTLDKRLVEVGGISNNELYLAYSRKLMLHHEFERAAIAFGKIDKIFLTNVLHQLNDSPKLWLKSAKSKEIKDPILYIQNMAKLKRDLSKSPNDAAINYQYAEALINISYHGQAWLLSYSYHSVSEPFVYYWMEDLREFTQQEMLLKEYYGLETALNCLNVALKHCDDEEFCAQIAYLGALAEVGEAWWEYRKNEPRDNEEQMKYEKANSNLLENKYRNYFNKLKTQYAETDYAKMIIQECDDFAKYANY